MNDGVALAAVAVVYMAVAAWAAQPPYTCAMVTEPARHLNLERGVDREHLGRDAADISRMARRYAAHLPFATGGSSAEVVEACEGRLAREVADAHGVTLEQIRRATPGGR